MGSYQPCKAPGATATYQQQLRFLQHHTAEFQPRTALYEDLFMECTEWMDEGDQLIIGIDANEDVRTGATSRHSACAMPSLTSIVNRVHLPPIIGITNESLWMDYL
jgi:hypothetical protein